MIGLDTNVLVRYIAQDDERQGAKAARFIEQECSETRPAFIAVVVLCEIAWVLEDCTKRASRTLLQFWSACCGPSSLWWRQRKPSGKRSACSRRAVPISPIV